MTGFWQWKEPTQAGEITPPRQSARCFSPGQLVGLGSSALKHACGSSRNRPASAHVSSFGTLTPVVLQSCPSNAPAQGSCHAALSVPRQPSIVRVTKARSVSPVWLRIQQHICCYWDPPQRACILRSAQRLVAAEADASPKCVGLTSILCAQLVVRDLL